MKSGQRIHRGEQRIANPNWPVRYWECWCGALWLGAPDPDASRWCPLAPAGSGPTRPHSVLNVEVTRPDWAAGSALPYAIGAQIGSVGTTLAAAATVERALLIACAIQQRYGDNPQAFRKAW